MRNVIFLLAALLLPLSALADKIVMKNGNTFEGEIVDENENQVVLKVQYGTMNFKKKEIESIIRGKPIASPPAPAPAPAAASPIPAGDSRESREVLRLLNEAERATQARDFSAAIQLLGKAKELASVSDSAKVPFIEAKIKKVKEQALVLIEITVSDIFTGHPPDPSIRRQKREESDAADGLRKEVEMALANIFKSALAQRGYIAADRPQAVPQRVQKLLVTYSDTGGAAYLDSSGNVIGNRIEARCDIELLSASGGVIWSGNVEAITPTSISGGSTRDAALQVLVEKLSTLSFGVSE